jgi:hypothetical protein
MSSPEFDKFREDPNFELARELFIRLAERIYSTPSTEEKRKPDPKVVAMLCFRLADAFEAAALETPKAKAAAEAASKAAVKLDEVDLTHVIQGDKKAAGT